MSVFSVFDMIRPGINPSTNLTLPLGHQDDSVRIYLYVSITHILVTVFIVITIGMEIITITEANVITVIVQ